MNDLVIPIVFPDYLITVETPRTRIRIPDLIPGIDLLPDDFEVPRTKNKFPELGHAGVLFIHGKRGTTKYYEYGRYAPKGIVRKVGVKDVTVRGNAPSRASLSYTLSQISIRSGKRGRIAGSYIEVPGQYGNMLKHAETRRKQNTNASRKEYDILSNSCNHFMKEIMEAAGLETPSMIDPRPNSYIDEIRDMYSPLDYAYRGHKLTVKNGPESLAFARTFSQPAIA